MFRGRAAFSLIEMVITVVILVIVMALLAPVIANRSAVAARRAICASNLKQIYDAYMVFTDNQRSRDGGNLSMDPAGWPTYLEPYLRSSSSRSAVAAVQGTSPFMTLQVSGASQVTPGVFVCPEDELPEVASLADVRIGVQPTCEAKSFDHRKIKFTLSLNEGYGAKKLSVIQRSQAKSLAGFPGSNALWASYFQSEHPGYQPDQSPGVYWIQIEDFQTGSSRSNPDYNDVHVKVEVVGDQLRLSPMQSDACRAAWLIDASTGRDLLQPAGPIRKGDDRSVLIGGPSVSYGFNRAWTELRGGYGNKLLVMDFENKIADPYDNWADWLDEDGALLQARHAMQMNAASADGSIKVADPQDIRPDTQYTRDRLWLIND